MSNGATAGAAAAAATAQAIKASGAIVSVEPSVFLSILAQGRDLVVVMAKGGLFKKNYQYLTGYKGLVFFTKSHTQLLLPSSIELITAKSIWMP